MLKKCLSISFMDLLSMSTFCEVFPFSAYKYNKGLYDKESTKGSIWVWLGGENESGQMVLKKVNLFWCISIPNNVKSCQFFFHFFATRKTYLKNISIIFFLTKISISFLQRTRDWLNIVAKMICLPPASCRFYLKGELCPIEWQPVQSLI